MYGFLYEIGETLWVCYSPSDDRIEEWQQVGLAAWGVYTLATSDWENQDPCFIKVGGPKKHGRIVLGEL